tara:strand:- start:2839 stop:3513 length:675 start_codon:yes stop_codon:yes gene_type:complete
VAEREQVVKRSCAFCQSEEREALEGALLSGEITQKQLDKEMGWRANTADRHYRNHMGDYHLAANPSCAICTHNDRGEMETAYFEGALGSEEIAETLGCAENTVYHHMKHHFQPLVRKSAAIEASLALGQEMTILRSNAERLNDKLNELMDDGSVHEDGFVRDAVSLHKEVRETIKDLVKLDEKWGPENKGTEINQTINILKVELAKESPDSWKRIKSQLLEQVE